MRGRPLVVIALMLASCTSFSSKTVRTKLPWQRAGGSLVSGWRWFAPDAKRNVIWMLTFPQEIVGRTRSSVLSRVSWNGDEVARYRVGAVSDTIADAGIALDDHGTV